MTLEQIIRLEEWSTTLSSLDQIGKNKNLRITDVDIDRVNNYTKLTHLPTYLFNLLICKKTNEIENDEGEFAGRERGSTI